MRPAETHRDSTADPRYVDRILTQDTYCATCGYNLKTLPFVGRCTECGGEYNARPLVMKGVFQQGLTVFPTGDVFAALFTWTAAIVLVISALLARDQSRLFFAVLSASLGVVFVRNAWRSLRSYLRYRAILKRIQRDWESGE